MNGFPNTSVLEDPLTKLLYFVIQPQEAFNSPIWQDTKFPIIRVINVYSLMKEAKDMQSSSLQRNFTSLYRYFIGMPIFIAYMNNKIKFALRLHLISGTQPILNPKMWFYFPFASNKWQSLHCSTRQQRYTMTFITAVHCFVSMCFNDFGLSWPE